MKRGFTLIELLVAVLIIGILAAVAVPQYQKAVDKARLSEMMQMHAALERAADAYILQHGFPNLGSSSRILDDLDISFPGFSGSSSKCNEKNVCVYASFYSEGITPYYQVGVDSWQGIELQGGPKYTLWSQKRAGDGAWTRSYAGCSSASPDLSKFGLETFGYSEEGC